MGGHHGWSTMVRVGSGYKLRLRPENPNHLPRAFSPFESMTRDHALSRRRFLAHGAAAGAAITASSVLGDMADAVPIAAPRRYRTLHPVLQCVREVDRVDAPGAGEREVSRGIPRDEGQRDRHG